jgi:hypothetical protein
MNSYIMYSIKLTGLNEVYFRRYSDFFALREKLVDRWPGIYIPNIPPKKSVVCIINKNKGNLETKIVEMRMKLLNTFCLKLYKFQDMFNSDEMKIFFSNVQDVKKALSSLHPHNYEELLLKYRKAFPNFYEVKFK